LASSRHGFIRSFAVTDAARHQFGGLLDPHNTASAVWPTPPNARPPTLRC
jgi:hypothetical protein